MLKTEGFWAGDSNKREHCYKVVPLDIAENPRQMTLHGFDRVYQALGELRYRFRDAGNNSKYVIISLNKPIRQSHLKQLEGTFSIIGDSGTELAFV